MPVAKNTDDLLAEVKARVAAPSANGLLSDAEILELADQEMRSELASLLISCRSEYWLTSYTVSITANTSSYRIPDRALGMGLRDVTLYDASNNEWNLVQVPADKRYLYARSTSNPPSVFTLENGSVVLLPTPSQSGYTLRLRYYAQPSTLAAVSTSGKILEENTTTSFVSYIADPTAFDAAGDYVDFVRGAGMFEVLSADNAITSWGAGGAPNYTIGVTSAVEGVQAAGNPAADGKAADWICLAGTTVFPPLPSVCWPVLVSATCRAYCEAIGDSRGMEAAAAIFERRKKTALDVLMPRVDGEPVQPMPIDTPLRGGRRWAGWVR